MYEPSPIFLLLETAVLSRLPGPVPCVATLLARVVVLIPM